MNRKRFIKRIIPLYIEAYKIYGDSLKGKDIQALKKFNLKNTLFKSYDQAYQYIKDDFEYHIYIMKKYYYRKKVK